jgi:predicted HicB family RNase H-like nuclease
MEKRKSGVERMKAIWIDEKLHNAVKVAAAKNGVSMAVMMKRIIDAFVDKIVDKIVENETEE